MGTDPLGTGEIGWIGIEEEGSEHLGQQGSGPLAVRLHIGESGREVAASLTKAVHLGRLDPASDIIPEVDPSEGGGSKKGVSRRHARILKRDKKIQGVWSGWPSSWTAYYFDAALYYPGNDKFYVFHGDEYVRHSYGRGPDPRDPKEIDEVWSGWPDEQCRDPPGGHSIRINAALHYAGI